MSVELKYGDGTAVELYDIACELDKYGERLGDVTKIASTGRVRIHWHEKPVWGPQGEWVESLALELYARTL